MKRVLSLVTVWLLCAGLASAQMPGVTQPLLLGGSVTFVRGGSGSSTSAGQTSASFSFDASSCDYLVAFLTGRASGGHISSASATYNSVAMTAIASPVYSGNDRVSVISFKLVSPASGSNTLAFSWSGTQTGTVYGAMCFRGVGAGAGTAVTFSGTTEGSPSVSVPSNPNSVVVSSIGIAGTGSTISTGNTSVWSVDPGNDSVKGGGSRAAGAASVSMSWTVASSVDIALIGVNIAP